MVGGKEHQSCKWPNWTVDFSRDHTNEIWVVQKYFHRFADSHRMWTDSCCPFSQSVLSPYKDCILQTLNAEWPMSLSGRSAGCSSWVLESGSNEINKWSKKTLQNPNISDTMSSTYWTNWLQHWRPKHRRLIMLTWKRTEEQLLGGVYATGYNMFFLLV